MTQLNHNTNIYEYVSGGGFILPLKSSGCCLSVTMMIKGKSGKIPSFTPSVMLPCRSASVEILLRLKGAPNIADIN